MNGLELWNKVETTDPKYTKPYTGKGGFKGTAIKPIYLIKKATELWGPMGDKWGAKLVSEDVESGAPLIVNGLCVANEKIHYCTVEVWYPGSDGKSATVQGVGGTILCGSNSKGFFTDDEAPKKSFTDGIGNALYRLGFSADIYEGTFDGSKYVEETHKPSGKPPVEPLEENLEQKLTDSIRQAKEGKEIEDRIAALKVEDLQKGMDLLKEIEAMTQTAPREKRKALLREKVKVLGWRVDKVNGVVVFSAPDPLNAA